MHTYPKIYGFTLDPKLTYTLTRQPKHPNIYQCSKFYHRPSEAITKETLLSTYKYVTRLMLEYMPPLYGHAYYIHNKHYKIPSMLKHRTKHMPDTSPITNQTKVATSSILTSLSYKEKHHPDWRNRLHSTTAKTPNKRNEKITN